VGVHFKEGRRLQNILRFNRVPHRSAAHSLSIVSRLRCDHFSASRIEIESGLSIGEKNGQRLSFTLGVFLELQFGPVLMLRCAFLTLEDPSGFVIDDELAYPALVALGWMVEAIPWSRPQADWKTYDAVVIRSTWDYINHLDAFLNVLSEIERSGALLFNPLDLVRWNIRKTYLRDLASRGVDVVPTTWRDRLDHEALPKLFDEIGAEEMVIKPIVGANASGAYRLDSQTARRRADEISIVFADCAFMAQPFLPAVTSEGEFSLFYFGGEHSHTILKTPKPGDFRVQEEHGGFIRAVETEPALRDAGDAALRAIGEPPLYVRADFVRKNDRSGFWVMELELIEPSLYFRFDPEAANRFAHCLHQAVGR
jgi:glutathione synthase/RimK-type ligase-like ATP-grasp enzyme